MIRRALDALHEPGPWIWLTFGALFAVVFMSWWGK